MSSEQPATLLGIDTGGTFTDFVCLRDGALSVHKRLSNPSDPAAVIGAGLEALGIEPGSARLTYGTTVATNAILEHRGASVALVVNEGFRDLLTIGRQARANPYDLAPQAPPAPVQPENCIETAGRIGPGGEVVESLTEAHIDAVVAAVAGLGVDAVAICLLFSYVDPAFEKALADALRQRLDGVFVASSADVLPVQREYERGMVTWMNAFVGPLAQRHLEDVAAAAQVADVDVMTSAANVVDADYACRYPVHLALSGPAGGLLAARHVADTCGESRLLTFDMGGTSTDVALYDSDFPMTTGRTLGPYPLALPMLDIHTVGAGGGSIAAADPAGGLRVGPQSAGARPGPACYGFGGRAMTVTDANVVLGRLPDTVRLGGSLPLDRSAALAAASRLGEDIGMEEPARVAAGVVALVNENMVAALRVISVERGFDPRSFCLLCFGGAGGLHVCEVAEALGISRILVPAQQGVLSALGMLVGSPGRVHERSVNRQLNPETVQWLLRDFAETEARLAQRSGLAGDGEAPLAKRSLAVSYRGQGATLDIPFVEDAAALESAFAEQHKARFGHVLAGREVFVASRRVRLYRPGVAPELAAVEDAPSVVASTRLLPDEIDVPVIGRSMLATERVIGPAVVTDSLATVFVGSGWEAGLGPAESLLLLHQGAAAQGPARAT